MLRRLLGPQGAAAVVLCGEALDGEAAARRGLAWVCVDDGALLDEAVRLATRATVAPRELANRLKGTMRTMGSVTQYGEAVEHELEPQLWSLAQPTFRERLAALKRRIARRDP
jgi:enoyl-CoA hydratase